MKMSASNAFNGALLNRAVLVLNANYSPMMVCTAKRAICMQVLDKVDILVNYKEKVSSPSMKINLPSVIKIRNFIGYDNLSVDLSRKNIISRDDGKCQYCGNVGHFLTIDHVLPKGRGGQDSWDNLVTACKPCNQKKGYRTPEEAGMQLRTIPKRPNRLLYFYKYVKNQQQEWRPYLFMEPFKIN
mgnify:CR=1 FL=1